MARSGRPPRGEYVNKARILSTRITSDLRALLDEAAGKSGRSLSQEIEYRLRRSFDEDRRIIEIFGGRENYAILRLISCVLDSHGRDWKTDEDNLDFIIAAISLILRLFGPNSTFPQFVRMEHGSIDAVQMAAFITGRVVAAHIVDAEEPPGADRGDPGPYIKKDLPAGALDRLRSLADAEPVFVTPSKSPLPDTEEQNQ